MHPEFAPMKLSLRDLFWLVAVVPMGCTSSTSSPPGKLPPKNVPSIREVQEEMRGSDRVEIVIKRMKYDKSLERVGPIVIDDPATIKEFEEKLCKLREVFLTLPGLRHSAPMSGLETEIRFVRRAPFRETELRFLLDDVLRIGRTELHSTEIENGLQALLDRVADEHAKQFPSDVIIISDSHNRLLQRPEGDEGKSVSE